VPTLTPNRLSAIIAAMRPWQIVELALLLVPGMLLLWRVRRCRKEKRGRSPSPPFSVIVPARNEESGLAALLASLERQSVKPAEIIVVDDGSTDATAAIAGSAGCRVIPAGRRPRGWLGKTWACWVGARHATSELLLFLDADTRLEREGCSRMLAERAARAGVVTIQPWHATGSPVEKLSSLFNIIAMAAINSFTAFGEALAPAGCFGPCILCSRDEYRRAGGHRAVRASILEDIDLGKRFLVAGIPVHCFGGTDSVSFRMYPGGLAQLVEGWSKNMARGAAGSHPLVFACLALWFTGLFSSAFFTVRWGCSGNPFAAVESVLFYLLYAAELLWMLKKVGNFGPLSALFYPLHLLFFLFVFFRSLVMTYVVRTVTWKGRSISRPDRGG
jgi:4,4'-diaponeurosporenoate glycosyltransferase